MQPRNLFTAVLLSLATLGVGAAVAAQADAGRSRIDANGDGVIERSEAAQSPRLAQNFEQMDTDKDGRLSQSELPKRGHHGRGGKHHGGTEKLDADGDGRISQTEAAGKGRMAEKFAAMDLNKDGYVVRSELRSYNATQRPAREAEMRARSDGKFAEADLNRDGKLSRVEVDEKMPRLAKRFNWNDDDRDGFLSRDELRPPARR
ncbi:MAG: EF-hand domain-containing protein [Luteimonas sp.]